MIAEILWIYRELRFLNMIIDDNEIKLIDPRGLIGVMDPMYDFGIWNSVYVDLLNNYVRDKIDICIKMDISKDSILLNRICKKEYPK